jgi:nitrate reductase NapE component
MGGHSSRRKDELAVLICLWLSVGMLVGTVVTIWMWTIVSGKVPSLP